LPTQQTSALFVALDRVLRQGWDRGEAFAVMRSVWVPDATWQAFIDLALAQDESRHVEP
jgi:hypothetical protein